MAAAEGVALKSTTEEKTMQRDPDQFYASILEMTHFKTKVRKFLQTHRHGIELILAHMKSIPSDRTADEYRQELAAEDAKYAAYRAETVERINRERASRGLDPILFQDLNGPEALE